MLTHKLFYIDLHFDLKRHTGTNMQRKRAVNITNYPLTPSIVTSHTNKINRKDHNSSWRVSQQENHKCYGKMALPKTEVKKLTQITDDALALKNDAHGLPCDYHSRCCHSLPAC